MLKFDVGVEIGTTETKICFNKNNISLSFPSVIAIKKNTNRIIGIGKSAYEMLGKAPETITVKKTINKGVVGDLPLTTIMLKEMLGKKLDNNIKKPSICVCFHSFMTDMEKMIFKNSISSSVGTNIYFIEESLASAIGAGLNLFQKNSFFVVNIGGGTTDIAAISLNGILLNKSIQIGSEQIDEIIYNNLKQNHNLLIGKSSAEKIKKKAITIKNPSTRLKFKIKGKDIISNLPKTITLSQKEICLDTIKPIRKITDTICFLIKTMSPDSASDIKKTGILLTGGGSLINGLKDLIEKNTGVVVKIAKNPTHCASFGALNSFPFLNEDLYDNFSQYILPA